MMSHGVDLVGLLAGEEDLLLGMCVADLLHILYHLCIVGHKPSGKR